jgi:uncharacterized protein
VSADTLLLVEMAGLLLVIGAIAGLVAGLLGVGGGIVLVPAFFYAFTALGYGSAQLMQVCLATSLATIITTSIRSMQSHHAKGAVDWSILRGWALFIGTGAVLGVLVAAALRSVVLQGIFGVVGVFIGLYFGFGRKDWQLGAVMPSGLKKAIIGPMIGLLSVLMGIGGGSFGVPLMTLHGVAIHRAVGTASGFGLIIALPSVLAFMLVPIDNAPPFSIGAVNLPAFALAVAMPLVTAPLGARLAHSMDPKRLRRIFAVFIMVMALNMLRKALGF